MNHCRQTPFGLFVIALTLFVFGAPQKSEARDVWTRVQSQNFTLIGNAGEKDIRQVANRLEQFRTVFSLLFPTIKLSSPVPTTVIVFKSNGSYKPFKVNPNVTGYFQPGEDVNYITLTIEKASEDQTFRTIFHEYVHLLVENTMGAEVPLWFNEGLAEYYSTFDIIEEDRKVVLGDLVRNHVLYLRENKLLPLRTLFAVDYKSPYYNEGSKMNIFYAESWMLMHYLLQGDAQKRQPQLGRFLELLRAQMSIGIAFQQAFQTSLESFESDFRSYLQGAKYMATSVTFEKRLDLDSEMQSTPINEAEAQAYLGDLLLHTRSFNDAETYLQRALSLSPDLSMAQASLGMLRVRQNRLEDARQYLEKAAAGDSQNFLAHYYYALALSGLSTNEIRTVTGYSPETAAILRAELKKAIALKPDFPESYALLGFVNVVRNEEVNETIALLTRALNISRANHRILVMLAQLHIRKEQFAEARQLLEPVARNSPNPELQQQAKSMLEAVKRKEEQRARLKEYEQEAASRRGASPRAQPAEGPTLMVRPTQPDLNSALAAALRKPQPGETRAQGRLTAIECNAKGIVFHVRAGDRLLRLHTDNFERVNISAFTPEVSADIRCGPLLYDNSVVISYTAAKAGTSFDGEANALEFVPLTFVLKP